MCLITLHSCTTDRIPSAPLTFPLTFFFADFVPDDTYRRIPCKSVSVLHDFCSLAAAKPYSNRSKHPGS